MYDIEPIVSIKEARLLLGKEEQNMSDEQIQRVVEDLRVLAEIVIKKIEIESGKKR